MIRPPVNCGMDERTQIHRSISAIGRTELRKPIRVDRSTDAELVQALEHLLNPKYCLAVA